MEGSAWNLQDYRVSVDVNSVDDGAFGLMFRYTNLSNYYKLEIDSTEEFKRLTRLAENVESVLAEASGGYALGFDMSLEVEMNGDAIQVLIDGADVFGGPVQDLTGALPSGTVALYSWDNLNVSFDNVAITAPCP